MWFGSTGEPLADEDWRDANDRVLGIGWRGWRGWRGRRGRRRKAAAFLVYMNAGEEARWVELPALESATRWRERLNTAVPESARILESRFELPVQATIVLEGEP